ncbi:MAG TPA: response regulator transcription factor [Chitinophagales bacterium]|nr:response regulator transcription factor [Chitinophagales bacterium]HPE97268.1 response regulator transcription factor [Chitinophagales bacterium]HPR29734.1 response regulator transcription factor [Chitinophagales bacterium]HQU39730.1 response regulator transcription factor [Chitinophagales bacterium]HQU76632.1 response regulator transcription factor [Chitinophagales bacterium]
MNTISVAIFEDNKHLRESLSILINGTPGYRCTGAYPDCQHLIPRLRSATPDVILLDIEMPGMNGLEALKVIREEFPSVQVLMQTMFDDDDYIFRAICSGAHGYILKSTSPAGYLESVADVHQGGAPMSSTVARKVLTLFRNHQPAESADYQLTAREREILSHMVEGKSFKMIAGDMDIAYETVRTHMKNIYSKLHVNSNTEAVSKAIRERLI